MKTEKYKIRKRNYTKIGKIDVKKYPYLLLLSSTRCDLKLPKRKELRLKQIRKEMVKLEREQQNLFKKIEENKK